MHEKNNIYIHTQKHTHLHTYIANIHEVYAVTHLCALPSKHVPAISHKATAQT